NEPKKPEALISGLESGAYQLIVLPFSPDNPAFLSTKVGEEHLMFYLPKAHRFSKRKSLTLAEMNGENMLLFSDIGFWHDLVAAKMPDSRFLVQNERYSLDELILNTILPCFSTDLSMGSHAQTGKRVCVPISDTEVNVTYYLLCKKENRRIFSALFPKPG
ncbi:MAG: LysR substrate-binding domain-containing protein, partial [Oscillospiraceae bacterium]